MWKSALFLAFMANVIYTVSTEGTSNSNNSSTQSPSDNNDTQNECNQPNEEYQQCPGCSPGTCESIGKVYNCPLEPSDSSECTGACRCKSGYYYNKIGECITDDQCLMCNGTHEYFSCGPECDNVCATLDQQNKTNCPIINIQCNKKCYCEDGYARDENNICVPIDQCTGGCKENERYSECPDAECEPKTCEDAGFPVSCPRKSSGRCSSKPACICNSGYLRNSDGVCVPQNECPSCRGDPNARPGCGVNCGRLCSNYKNSDEVACPAICNLNGCDCIEGYVLDTNTGKCVLPKQCTSPCGQNEVYSSCVNGGCDKRNCSQINKPQICVDPLNCIGGCVCRDGYLRESDGTCVPQDQCKTTKKHCNKPNEEYQQCVKDCSPGTSESIGKSYNCPAHPDCSGQCRCKSGYFRNKAGECITKDQCLCPDGETYSDCPPVYSKDCNSELCPASRNDTTVCRTTRQCGKPRCVCSYLRRRNRKTGKCVLASDCPPFPCNGPNEEYQSCPSTCPGENCTDYLSNSTCPKYKIGIVVPCQPLCRCLKGYYRNSHGICVKSSQCTECPEGEVYSKCPPTQCDAEYCPHSRNYSLTCPTPKTCLKPRCICGFNSHRDRHTGKCIPTSQCPAFPCDGQNEVYNSCPPSCPGQNCSDYINNSTCPTLYRIGIVVPCKPACRCDNNTYRNLDGDCVNTQECETLNVRPRSTTEAPEDDQLNDLRQGNSAFTGNFLFQVLVNNPGENLIMSPFSVLIPLAELALYAEELSLTQLLKVFNLQNKDEIRSNFPKLLDMLDSEQNNTLDLGARVYVNQDYELTQDFEKDTKLFNATADTINVNDPDGAASKINEWVSDATRGKIPDLVSSDMITPLTRLILANAIYCKGTWKTQFDPANTKDQDFYVTKKDTSQVQMMKLKDKFNFAEISHIDAKVLELPYVGGDLSFLAFLPNQIDGLVSLIDKLRDEAVFNNAVNNLSSETVTVSLPKMDISTTIDLKELLQQLNITGIFNSSDSGLSGIVTKKENLFVTGAIQKATITSNEEGSEASAANEIGVGFAQAVSSNPPQEYYFTADHPVAYYIRYKKFILFCGTFIKP